MSKFRVLIGLTLLLSLFATGAKAQTQSVKFTLVNGTSRTLESFYASPPSTSDWEEDILGVDVLPPGESTEITINDGREDCNYDFKGVLGPSDDGSVGRGALIQSAVNVCDGGSYTYYEN
ncbi:hypothetical protein [Planktothrix mougeotii]|uniref:Uncharacterized protein n=1 Tax=Planktothrix mougeotii LEGE 06226 TaxID=1828728 RepID=A0ABR9UFM2_9CYAN|nr:hypothetical protein [Planktothrix mougeotii]MBE9145266.1 hypothetical protein [Planktothrix mougeotii LEGE 06226]